ncbi:glutamic acid-rich protein isoform X1 [Cucumis melo var. makuwa]|nr:glutamic acid-rich protein isoform X1 [Cucumis melo var. makuwa]
MKISSKSILSPGRHREPSQISLSTSLSRRLKSSGSLKGGQASPMFPTGRKKRGCAFDNPEPSSPKVTCIGQVRVKTKKQGKKMRARSQKRRTNSEASFRRSESVVQSSQVNSNDQQFSSHHNHHLLRQNSNSNAGNGFQQECLSHRNQRWVHLPFTICEALRAFGAELNCFLPCHSSCSGNRENNKEPKPAERSSESESSCGTVFARWLVAVQDGDGKGREIELVVGDEETRTEKENGSQRRHVFEGLDFKDKNEAVEEEESRISICIPPKNALLLMRCRSDPVKMAELAKRFCEPPAPKVDEEDEEEGEDEDNEAKKRKNEVKRDVSVPVSSIITVNKEEEEEEEEEKEEDERKVEQFVVKLENEEEVNEESVSDEDKEKEEANLVLQEEQREEKDNEEETIEMATENDDEQKQDITVVNQLNQEQALEEKEEDKTDQVNQQETMAIPIPIQTHCEPEMAQDAEKLESVEKEESKLSHESEQDQKTEEDEILREEKEEEEEEEEEGENGENPTSPSLSVETKPVLDETETEVDGKREEEEEEEEEEEKATDEGIGPDDENNGALVGPEEEDQSKERETPPPEPEPEPEGKTQTETSVLPDCLLLMMYEPKLSMEVSKETWVCSADFIRCVPTREKKTVGRDPPPPPPPKKRETKPTDTMQTTVVQPARWSCSFPAAAAAAAMIEQKLARAKGYEPFVLTRCKSEPMRSSAKLAPDACFWKDRKLEPHRPATFGVGAAEVGF